MSKRSLFWGNGSGKLGEAVFYRAGGEQRTRTYVKDVKNPKSYQQALQRTKFNNLVGCYKGIATAVKSFYTNKNANQSPFNAFFRQNWGVNRWVSDKESCSYSEGVFQDMYVANGDVNIDTSLSIDSPTLGMPNYYLVWSVPAGKYSIPEGLDKAYVSVGKQFYELLVGENNPYGLPSEFYVTVMLFQQGYVNQGAQTFTIRCSADSQEHFRFVQGSPKLPVPTQTFMDSLVKVGAGDLTAPESSTPGTAENVTKLCIGPSQAAEETFKYGAAVVISFKDSSGKKCTRSVVTYGQGLQETAADYTPQGQAGMSIISSYQVANTLIE